MTRTRTFATVALLLLACAGLSVAAAEGGGRHHGGHGAGGPGGDPAHLIERMTRRLNLDEEQQVAVDNILAAAKPEFEALRERGQANREAMRELDPSSADYSALLNNLALESGQIVTDGALLFGRVRGEVHAILTPEQIAEAKAAMAERLERRAERREERRSRRSQ